MDEIKLEIGGTYETNVHELVQIKEMPEEGVMKNQMKVYNISESCHQWLDVKKHRMIKRIR